MNTHDSRWEVQLEGGSSDLEHLARHFTSGTATVFKDDQDGAYLYYSDSFDACATSEEVLHVADDQLSVLSGVLRFVRESHEPLRTGAVCKRHANGSRDVFVHIRDSLQLRAEFGEVTVSVTDAAGNLVQKPASPPRTVTISALATNDAAVTKAMRLFA